MTDFDTVVPAPDDDDVRALARWIAASDEGIARTRLVRLARYRLDDGLYPGTLAEAADRLSWACTRLLVVAGVGRARRWLRRMMRS